jgi:hypothetical protein
MWYTSERVMYCTIHAKEFTMAETVVLLLMNLVISFGVIIAGYGMFVHKEPVPPSEHEIVFTVRPPVDLGGDLRSERLSGFPTEAAAQQACIDLRSRLEREDRSLQECRVSPIGTASDPPLDGAHDE